jgi:YHS domain-containing protein
MPVLPSRHRSVVPLPLIGMGAVCAAISLNLGSAVGMEPDPISWRGDYAGALEEARAANRLLWIQFTGPWCPNCTRMEHESFPDPAIIQHARESFVPLKLRSDVHEQLALGFNLSGLPATVIVAPSREVVVVRQGYLGPDELDMLLREVLAGRRAPVPPGESAGLSSGLDTAARPDRFRPKSESRLALSGYCPVSLISDRRLVPGQTEYTVQHEGRIYRFASLVMRNVFRRDPERYVPVNRGECPVSQVERSTARAGDPRWGVLYDGRLYLCATEEDRRRFLKDPQRYAQAGVAQDGFCPHCLEETGLLVRGDPKYGVTRDGRRYWFESASHRDAYLAEALSAGARR